jgi:hypothetical protein
MLKPPDHAFFGSLRLPPGAPAETMAPFEVNGTKVSPSRPDQDGERMMTK